MLAPPGEGKSDGAADDYHDVADDRRDGTVSGPHQMPPVLDPLHAGILRAMSDERPVKHQTVITARPGQTDPLPPGLPRSAGQRPAHRHRDHRGSLQAHRKRQNGHNRREMGARRRRGHPQAPSPHRQRRLRRLLALPPPPRARTHPPRLIPRQPRPSSITSSPQKSRTHLQLWLRRARLGPKAIGTCVSMLANRRLGSGEIHLIGQPSVGPARGHVPRIKSLKLASVGNPSLSARRSPRRANSSAEARPASISGCVG